MSESDLLLPNENPWPRRIRIFVLVLLVGAVVGGVVALVLVVGSSSSSTSVDDVKNVIMVIPDGFGPSSQTLARAWAQETNGDISLRLPLDIILEGNSRTRSSSSLVTDSAAGATAYSCAMKTYNRAIAVDDDLEPCGTLLEAAQLQQNMVTGMVVTSRLTHATPASFNAHIDDRNLEEEIAAQQVGSDHALHFTTDLMLGGGLDYFSAETRSDGRDLLAEAVNNGYTYISTTEELNSLPADGSSLPLLGIFADDHISFELDRDETNQPSLADMTSFALSELSRAVESNYRDTSDGLGFFLMVEGSRIDHAAHSNDAAAHLYEVLGFNDAIQVLMDFVDEHPNTVLLVSADHETGGITLDYEIPGTDGDYDFYPLVLSEVQRSFEVIETDLEDFYDQPGNGEPELRALVETTVFPEWLGIDDATTDEVDLVVAAIINPNITGYDQRDPIVEPVYRRAQIGFATHGHTGVDVQLYSYGQNAVEVMRGNHDNTEVGQFIADYLNLDLAAVTSMLKSASADTAAGAAVDEAAAAASARDADKHTPDNHRLTGS